MNDCDRLFEIWWAKQTVLKDAPGEVKKRYRDCWDTAWASGLGGVLT